MSVKTSLVSAPTGTRRGETRSSGRSLRMTSRDCFQVVIPPKLGLELESSGRYRFSRSSLWEAGTDDRSEKEVNRTRLAGEQKERGESRHGFVPRFHDRHVGRARRSGLYQRGRQHRHGRLRLLPQHPVGDCRHDDRPHSSGTARRAQYVHQGVHALWQLRQRRGCHSQRVSRDEGIRGRFGENTGW